MSIYRQHPSKQLNAAFRGYQGQAPEKACFIFLGLDANFPDDIEADPSFPVILEYLSNGVKYWVENEQHYHHPFMAAGNEKRPGYKYHKRFSNLKLGEEYAEKISFVELLSVPTCGNTNIKALIGMLDSDHLQDLEGKLINSTTPKVLFLTRGVYRHLLRIRKEYACFAWLPGEADLVRNRLTRLCQQGVLTVYVITHFSDAISNEHLAEIREVITEVRYGKISESR